MVPLLQPQLSITIRVIEGLEAARFFFLIFTVPQAHQLTLLPTWMRKTESSEDNFTDPHHQVCPRPHGLSSRL